MEEMIFDFKQAKKTFSRIGLAMCTILVVTTVLQLVWFLLPELLLGEGHWLTSSSWGMWLGTFIPQYLIAIPLSLLVMHKLPAQKPADNKLTAGAFLLWLPICFCVMYAGSLVGNMLSYVLSNGNAQNAVEDYAMDTNPVKVLFLVILAPLMEEYVCRKQIIDRTRQYGEKAAVFLSALAFGLLHQNLFQFFYAFGLGLIFGYIYIRTGRLRYTVLLHGIINFVGGVVAPWVITLIPFEELSQADMSMENMMALLSQHATGFLIYVVYILFLLSMSIVGLVLLIIKSTSLVWQDGHTQLPKGTAAKTAYWNFGMVLYILICLSTMILSLM